MGTNWFRRMCDRGFRFPNSYIVFDVETSGLDVNRDYICQFGHLVVEDRKPREPLQIILDWTRCEQASHGDVRQRFYEAEADMKRRGRPYRFNYDRIAKEGVDPVEVLEIYLKLFQDHQAANCYFLTHNGFRYDAKIVCSHFKRFLGVDFKINHERMVDTGLFEKARQLDMMLRDGELLPDFYTRVEKVYGKGVFWSLDKHCIPNYKLAERHNLDTRKAHTAAFDCYVTHLLMEEFRQQAE